MTDFRFDAAAALCKARERRDLPNPPNPPNRDGDGGAGLGRLGGLGPGRGLPHASAAELRAQIEEAFDIFEERAAIREFDGGKPCAEAEAAALHETADTAVVSAGEIIEAIDSHATHTQAHEGIPRRSER